MKLLYLGAHCLLDTSSGAAISLLTLLEELAAGGDYCASVSAAVFDHAPGDDATAMLLRHGPGEPAGNAGRYAAERRRGRNGVQHYTLLTSASRRMDLSPDEELQFYRLACRALDDIRPQAVIGFGGLLLDRALFAAARRRCIRTVFYLANEGYGDPETFNDVDRVLTPSHALARRMAQRLGVQPVKCGPFRRMADKIAPRHEPRYISFINPSPAKGASLFARLAQWAETALPEARFQVVVNRGAAAHVQQALDGAALPANIRWLPLQDDMRPVYASTRLLLFPSFWFEASGGVGLEALANGIPVLAADVGGIAETLGDGAVLLPVPRRCQQDHKAVPSDAELRPWCEALERLLRDGAAYARACERARAAAARYDLGRQVADARTLICGL